MSYICFTTEQWLFLLKEDAHCISAGVSDLKVPPSGACTPTFIALNCRSQNLLVLTEERAHLLLLLLKQPFEFSPSSSFSR